MNAKAIVHGLTRAGVSQLTIARLAAARTAVLGLLSPSFLKGVVLELSTFCNRRCAYCPVCLLGTSDEVMSDQVLDAVVKNLAGFDGTVDLGGFFSEPLARPEIIRKALPRLREAAPKAFLRIYSNGDYLTENLCGELFAMGVDYLYVTIHDNDEDRRRKIFSWPVARGGRVRVDLAREIPIFNRSGYAVKGAAPASRFCVLQFAPVIGHDGRVFLCCGDLQKRGELGDLGRDGLAAIARRTHRLRIKILVGLLPTPSCRQCFRPTLGRLPFEGFPPEADRG